MKYFFLSYFIIALLIVSAAGFRGDKSLNTPIEIFQDMDHQAKVKYQVANDFFADGSGSRKPVANTAPIGYDFPSKSAADGPPPAFGFSNGVDYFSTGKIGDFYGDGFPKELDVDQKLLERGQQRYNIYCGVCHGASGNGKGVTSRFGIMGAYNFQQEGATDAGNAVAYRSTGSIFDTITNGKGLMGPYGGSIPVRDRWAIVAYIRTLQLAGKEAGVQ
jgi:mono/diheme cytochrome c family protein